MRKMKLKGQATLVKGNLTFCGSFYDETTFSVVVAEDDVELKESLDDVEKVDCFLYVIMEAQQDDRCYLTLPKPSLRHGKQVLVNRNQLVLPNTPIKREISVPKKKEAPSNLKENKLESERSPE